MSIRSTVKEFCDKKPLSPWFPIGVGIGAAVGAGPDVSMGVGVALGVAGGMVMSALAHWYKNR